MSTRTPDELTHAVVIAGGGLHSRSIEILDQRGIADRFLSPGWETARCPGARGEIDIATAHDRDQQAAGVRGRPRYVRNRPWVDADAAH